MAALAGDAPEGAEARLNQSLAGLKNSLKLVGGLLDFGKGDSGLGKAGRGLTCSVANGGHGVGHLLYRHHLLLDIE